MDLREIVEIIEKTYNVENSLIFGESNMVIDKLDQNKILQQGTLPIIEGQIDEENKITEDMPKAVIAYAEDLTNQKEYLIKGSKRVSSTPIAVVDHYLNTQDPQSFFKKTQSF